MGGVNIPLPELDLPRPAPNPAPDPLSEFARASQLRTQAAQTQGLTQDNQMRQLQLNDAQTLRSLAPKHVQKDQDGKLQGFDTEGYLNEALASGVNPSTVDALRNKYYESVKNAADATKAQRDNENAANDQIFEIGQSLRDLGKKASPPQPSGGPATALPGVSGAAQTPPPASLQATPEMMAAWHQALPKLMRLNPQAAGQLNPNQFPTEDQIDSLEAGLGLHKQALNEAKETATTHQAEAKSALDNAEAGLKNIQLNLAKNATPGSFDQQIDGIYPSTTAAAQAQNLMLKGQINASLSRGDVESAKKIIAGALENVQAVNKDIAIATNPALQSAKVVLAQRIKQAEQTITQGNPAEAGKLLADGSLTLSELKSRGTTPEFITQATKEAQKVDPQFNPQRTEAEFNVAKSPSNLAFFGSAKSLTDKGGTLDQLAAAAKDIPEHQIPIFNSIDDAVKAATGSGPIAKYASLLVGVSDDYSKVMGGGQGSDTSRNQAFNLVAAKQSPAQKAGAIEGIRGAVGSQTKSRIGKNKVLQKMYGSELDEPAGQSGAGNITVTDPRGTIHTFKDQASADNFKRLANIK